MPENSKLQPAKLGKNFDPVDHSNRNFFFSLILSILLHWLIYFLFEHREDFFPSKPKLVKLNPENLLVLKRGHSQDVSYTHSEPTRLRRISYAVFCLKKKKKNKKKKKKA
ncbi:hypothetical protein HpBGD53_11960 [Helicobacter pylori]